MGRFEWRRYLLLGQKQPLTKISEGGLMGRESRLIQFRNPYKSLVSAIGFPHQSIRHKITAKSTGNDYIATHVYPFSKWLNTKKPFFLSSPQQSFMDPGIVISTIGVFVQVIFDKYLSSKLEQWAIRANLGCEFQNLRGHLEMAQAILETLKGSPAMGEGIYQLAQELKSSAYNAEDVLDELDYFRLMEIVEDESKEKVAGSSRLSFPSALQSVFHQSGALMPPFKRARHAVDIVPYDWDTVSSKMKSIADSLQRAAANIERVAQLKKLVAPNFQQPQFPSSRQTSSLLTEPEVYGRDEEKKTIISMLLEPNLNSSVRNRLSVIPVVGIGGVGKTTLVQYVYNEPTIMNSFEVRAWACVSGFLDVKQVTIDILQSIDEEENHQLISLRCLDNIQTMLAKKLKKRKFLIVLDDVWSCSNWELLYAPFPRGAHGSKIVVTTRHHDIANSVGNTPHAVTLRGLEADPFWSLFKQKAFGDANISGNLALIGRKIANKLNGIPLAAKTIGKLLHKQLTSKHWMSILDSNLWELRQGPEDIMPALLLSYQHLPPNVQRCFAFVSAFPKDHSVSEEELIYSWMAHGFIQTMRGDKTMEDVAREYLYELVSASFFEASANDNLYRMHGLLHDLACSVSQDECSNTNYNFSRGIPNTVRHSYLLYPDQANNFCLNFSLVEPRSLCHGEFLERQRKPSDGYVELKNLRSIWFMNASTIALSNDGFGKMSISYSTIVNLRMLCLHHLKTEALLETVGDLIHLRYLDLKFSDISELPESVCKLYHLQVLDIRSCKYLVKLPTGINNLISIRHLLLDDSSKFLAGYAAIPYIGKLTSLQELDRFIVLKGEAFNIKQLKDLSEMGQSLSIEQLENVANREEASQSGLKEKCRLNELNLLWSSNLEDRAIDEEINILEGLQPHPNLKCLRIIYYMGNISPTWLTKDLNIKYLESLYLQDCSGWKVLPPLGQLPYLKKLHLIGMESILFIGSEFYGSGLGFPCLEELYFEKMPVWHSWYGDEEAYCFLSLLKLAIVDCSSLQVLPVEQWSGQARRRWFPRLSTLFIQNCPHLDQLPPLPHAPTLSRISIKNVGIISNLELDDEGIVISFMSNLRAQKQYYLQFQNLRRLKSFSISSYGNFVVLPSKGQGELVVPDVSPTMHDVNCSLSSINELRISGSGISEDILHEIFANAGILDCLSLKYCPRITSLELSAMMRLDYLVVEDFLQLTSLKCRQTLIHLRELNVLRSPKFVEAWKDLIRETEGSSQEIIASLKRLHIDDSSFLTMSICRTLGYLQYLMIDSDQQIMSLTEDQEQAFCQLTSLQTLVFSECPSLCTLPARLHQISSLKRLDLLSCESINSLPHQGLPGSLETLFIAGCSQLRENCIDGGTDQTKIEHVREIIL